MAKARQAAVGIDSVFGSSITDLMTSLAVVFIMLLVGFIAKANEDRQAALKARIEAERAKKEAEAVNKKAREAREALKDLLSNTESKKALIKKLLKEKGIRVEEDPNDSLTLVYHATEASLKFDFDRAELKNEGRTFLQWYVPRMLEVIYAHAVDGSVESVLIQGHTDSSGTREHNLQLSQQRAFSVLQFALRGCHLPSKQSDGLLNIASISGRGDRDLLPMGSKPGLEDPDKSRRVEFKIRVKSFEKDATQTVEKLNNILK